MKYLKIQNNYYKDNNIINDVDLDDKPLITNNIIVKEIKKESIKIL